MFVVEKDGSLSKIHAMISPKGTLSAESNAEVTRVLATGPKWIPGTRNGEPVNLKHFVLFNFNRDGHFTTLDNSNVTLTKPLIAGEAVSNTDEVPSFPGGEAAFNKFLSDNIKYPKAAKDAKIEGKLWVNFIVEKDGTLGSIHVLRDPGYGLGDEAVHVIKLSPKWIPGTENGKTVRVNYTLPVSFSLATNKATSPITPQINNSLNKVNEEPVYKAVKVMPSFPGGDNGLNNFLTKNIRYPKEAKESNVQGKVILQFIVEPDGALSNIKALRGPGPGLGAEAMRVMAMSPKWTPGIQDGKAVRVQFTIPINFSMVGDAAGDIKYFYKYVAAHVRYAADAKARNIQGRVFVTFTVDANNKPQNIAVLRSPDRLLSDEVVRVVSNFEFTDGKPNVSYTLPVIFSIGLGDNKWETQNAVDAKPYSEKARVSNTEKVDLNEVVVVTYK